MSGDGWVPATDRNLVAEKRARLDRAAALAAARAAGQQPVRKARGRRKTGDPRRDRLETTDDVIARVCREHGL